MPISVIARNHEPFYHLYMDIIGPLGNNLEYKYCLCLIDSHTRYPFAFPLRSVTAKAVCDCLLQVFSSVGVSSVITSDQETCFTTELTQRFFELFGCSPRWSSPLHPESAQMLQTLLESGNFYVQDGLLYHRDKVLGQKVNQLCLPRSKI